MKFRRLHISQDLAVEVRMVFSCQWICRQPLCLDEHIDDVTDHILEVLQTPLGAPR